MAGSAQSDCRTSAWVSQRQILPACCSCAVCFLILDFPASASCNSRRTARPRRPGTSENEPPPNIYTPAKSPVRCDAVDVHRRDRDSQISWMNEITNTGVPERTVHAAQISSIKGNADRRSQQNKQTTVSWSSFIGPADQKKKQKRKKIKTNYSHSNQSYNTYK